MTRRRKVILTCLLVFAAGLAWLTFKPNPHRAAAEATRQSLREQGLKLVLSDFGLSLSDEEFARFRVLTNAGDRLLDMASGIVERLPLVTPISDRSARVTWREPVLSTGFSSDSWPQVHASVQQRRGVQDEVVAAILAGPVRSTPRSLSLGGRAGHAGAFRSVGAMLGEGAVTALNLTDTTYAWTNLLALTQLATQWEPDPPEVAHIVRCALTHKCYSVTWEVLQANSWTDEQLGRLQEMWEAAEFWERLPDTAAFMRVQLLELLLADREEFSRKMGQSLGARTSAAVRHPAQAWGHLKIMARDLLHSVAYRAKGTYEDEETLLRFFEGRETDIQKAIRCTTWEDMRDLPGAKKPPIVEGSSESTIVTLANMRLMMSFIGGAQAGLLAQAATAETQRRLAITALALHRYRSKYDGFPPSLDALAPEFLEEVPVDFMDGEPLRYLTTDDGHFVLWSVGLDCIDDHGTMSFQMASGPSLSAPMGDIVWPRPATEEEMVAYREEINEVLAWVRGETEDRPPDDLLQKHGYGWQATPPY